MLSVLNLSFVLSLSSLSFVHMTLYPTLPIVMRRISLLELHASIVNRVRKRGDVNYFKENIHDCCPFKFLKKCSNRSHIFSLFEWIGKLTLVMCLAYDFSMVSRWCIVCWNEGKPRGKRLTEKKIIWFEIILDEKNTKFQTAFLINCSSKLAHASDFIFCSSQDRASAPALFSISFLFLLTRRR